MGEDEDGDVSKGRGELVRLLREKRAWTQEHLANVANISIRTIQRLEHKGIASKETLMAVASALEVDIGEFIDVPSTTEGKERNRQAGFLFRVTDGKDLCDIVIGKDMYHRDHDPVRTGEEAHLVGAFLQDIHDWGEIWSDCGPAQQVEASHRLTERINELEEHGFWVFCGRYVKTIRLRRQKLDLSVGVVTVLGKENPKIMKIAERHALAGLFPNSVEQRPYV